VGLGGRSGTRGGRWGLTATAPDGNWRGTGCRTVIPGTRAGDFRGRRGGGLGRDRAGPAGRGVRPYGRKKPAPAVQLPPPVPVFDPGTAPRTAPPGYREAFLDAFRHLSRYGRQVAFGAWLNRVVVNRCLKQLDRRALPMQELPDGDAERLAGLDDAPAPDASNG
jgi:hypothetical protein